MSEIEYDETSRTGSEPVDRDDGVKRPNRSRRRVWIVLAISAVLFAGAAAAATRAPDVCRGQPVTCGQVAWRQYVEPIVNDQSLDESNIPSRDIRAPGSEVVTASNETPTAPDAEIDVSVEPAVDLPFYGMQYVPEEDLAEVASLGVNTVLQDFSIDGSPAEWIAKLDVAAANDLSVVAWQWSPGWEWDEAAGEWDVDRRAVSFLETVEGHPALFAVYGTHEAYWNGCFGCGYTSEQLRMLYSQIKAIADVPVYSAFDGFEFWRDFSEETTFSDGICDFCDTWYYPVLLDGGYDRAEYVNRLATEIRTFRELAPNSNFVWVLQSFESELAGRQLPNAEQLEDMARLALFADIDGLWWYTWTFDEDQYEEVLVDHPDLHGVVSESYQSFLDEMGVAQ